ncbi:DUF883 family protein [Roseococcus pinisoli]|uniref:DUF883 domain-containing protein n=1 Tax=Roseococcus pinisoli TaxID=2835040 RepID=A0ABS5QEL7_9PROT|nr:hypothetical protein [Roseococcus pinisoli]MBS7812142.1 hypothetical protein [Roseococcus pinisoli]
MSQTVENARNLANDAKNEAQRLAGGARDLAYGAKDDASRLVSDARAEISQLREKVESLLNDRVTPAVSAVADRASSLGKSASETVRHQADRASDAVHDKPLIALGVAALAGFVIASLIRR